MVSCILAGVSMEERFEKLCRELENVKKELAELKKEKKDDAQ